MGGRARRRFAAEVAMTSYRRRVAFLISREVLLLWFCVIGAWLFLNHGLLYLQPGTRLANAPPQAYALTTAVIYIFIRGVSLAMGIRPPSARAARGTRRTEDPIGKGVRPIRRSIVTAPETVVGTKQGALLWNAVVHAQPVIPALAIENAASLPLEPGKPGVGFPVLRVTKEAWKPPWMAGESRRP